MPSRCNFGENICGTQWQQKSELRLNECKICEVEVAECMKLEMRSKGNDKMNLKWNET